MFDPFDFEPPRLRRRHSVLAAVGLACALLLFLAWVWPAASQDHSHDGVENPGLWTSPADGESGCCNLRQEKNGKWSGDCRQTDARFLPDGRVQMLKGQYKSGDPVWIDVPASVIFKEPSKDHKDWLCEMNGYVSCAKLARRLG